MKWQAKISDRSPLLVDLPAPIVGDSWTPIQAGEKNFWLQWNTQLGAFYLKDETGLERPVKLRSYNSVQYPGESERTFHLEISGRGPQLIDRVEAIVEPYVPGTAFRKSADAAGGAVVRSPMVGKIINVLVKDGDEVKKGQELLVIEAMKMENKIFSPASGTVSHLKATPGEQTGVGDQLLKIESE